MFISNRPKIEARAKAGRFDQISIALHWLTVLLIVAQLTTAWIAGHGSDHAPIVLTAHRSMGVLTWIVVAARLIWRHGFAYLPPFPASMSKLQQRVAKLNEYGLYGFLLFVPLAGVGSTLFLGRPFTLFAWQVPAILAPDKTISHLFRSLHEFGVWALLMLIALHATAALFHGLILRDGVLQRMLPWTERWGACHKAPSPAECGCRQRQIFSPDCAFARRSYDTILHHETDDSFEAQP